MARFLIDTTELYWIDESVDNPEDLCLHGHAIVYIGEEKIISSMRIIRCYLAVDTFMSPMQNLKM